MELERNHREEILLRLIHRDKTVYPILAYEIGKAIPVFLVNLALMLNRAAENEAPTSEKKRA